jgi:transcriptional regulator with XRE-family HTH domain
MATKKQTAARRTGDLLRERRQQLGLTQADVVAQGGPSAQTLRHIENGHLEHDPKPYTIVNLERVLQLPRGTIDEVMRGGDMPALPETPAESTDQMRAMARELLARAERTERRSGDATGVRSMRLPDELWSEAVEVADEEGRPVSALIRDAIRDYLARENR